MKLLNRILFLSLLLFSTFFHTNLNEIITAKFRVRQNFVNKNDTYRRLWSVEKRAKPFCVMECSRDIECASVLYNNVTKICQGHSVTLGNPAVAFDEPNTQYFVQTFGERYIGDSCVTTADCWTINTECRQGLCQCIPGYSFSPKTHECKVCVQYDDRNFMEVIGQYIIRENAEEFFSVTLEECRHLCLNRTTYLCVTFEFAYPEICAIQNMTKLDMPDKWYDSGGLQSTSHFQRDCA
ncbi:hypothetical protein ACF0H5_006175 [Mactra antiquata]